MAAPVRNWSLQSGERQSAEQYADVKANHRARYDWAVATLGRRADQLLLDCFCGNGYGTRRLVDGTGATVLGLDGSGEAIAQADRCYGRGDPRVWFAHREFPCALPVETYDAIVSFESMEHVADDALFAARLTEALKPGGRLLLSVPNEAKVPHALFRNPFHVRHYTRAEVLARFAGLQLDAWYGQDIHDWRPGQVATRLADAAMALVPEQEGQSLVFAFTKEGG